jgi:periplasmic protein CpxP/Spy
MRVRLAALLIIASAATLSAQGGGRGRGLAPVTGDSVIIRRRQIINGDTVVMKGANRADLEQQVQQRIAQVTKQQLGLNDAQMTKLQETNRKYDEKRRLVVDQERDVRMSLRDEMLRPDSARQTQVAALLDRVIKTQRQRVDIQEQEQKELAGFLTPIQRAKYFALEQQVRQRVNQMRQAQLQGRGGRMGRGQGQPGMPMGRGRGVQPPPPPQ